MTRADKTSRHLETRKRENQTCNQLIRLLISRRSVDHSTTHPAPWALNNQPSHLLEITRRTSSNLLCLCGITYIQHTPGHQYRRTVAFPEQSYHDSRLLFHLNHPCDHKHHLGLSDKIIDTGHLLDRVSPHCSNSKFSRAEYFLCRVFPKETSWDASLSDFWASLPGVF